VVRLDVAARQHCIVRHTCMHMQAQPLLVRHSAAMGVAPADADAMVPSTLATPHLS
jgi:hypothetical protein